MLRGELRSLLFVANSFVLLSERMIMKKVPFILRQASMGFVQIEAVLRKELGCWSSQAAVKVIDCAYSLTRIKISEELGKCRRRREFSLGLQFYSFCLFLTEDSH